MRGYGKMVVPLPTQKATELPQAMAASTGAALRPTLHSLHFKSIAI